MKLIPKFVITFNIWQLLTFLSENSLFALHTKIEQQIDPILVAERRGKDVKICLLLTDYEFKDEVKHTIFRRVI